MLQRKNTLFFWLIVLITLITTDAQGAYRPAAHSIDDRSEADATPSTSGSADDLITLTSGRSTPTISSRSREYWPEEEQHQYTSNIVVAAQQVLDQLCQVPNGSKVRNLHPVIDETLQNFLKIYTKSYTANFAESITINEKTKPTTRLQIIFVALSVCASTPINAEDEKPSLQFFSENPRVINLAKHMIAFATESAYKNIATNCLRLLLEIAAKLHDPALRRYIFYIYYHLIRLEYGSYANDFFPANMPTPKSTISRERSLVQFLTSLQEKGSSRVRTTISYIWNTVNQPYDNSEAGLEAFISNIKSIFDVATTSPALIDQNLFDKEKFAYTVFTLGLFMYCHSSVFTTMRTKLKEPIDSQQYKQCSSCWAFLINLFFHIQNGLEEKHLEKYHMRLHFSSVLLLIYNFDFLSYKKAFIRFEDQEKQSFAQSTYMLTLLLVRKNVVECRNHEKTLRDTARLLIAAGLTIAMSAIPGLIFSEPLIAGGISAIATAASGGRSWDYIKQIHTDLQKESTVPISEIKFETLQYADNLCTQVKLLNDDAAARELRTATLVFLARKKRTFFDRIISEEKKQEALMKHLIRTLKRTAKTPEFMRMQETISRVVENPAPDEALPEEAARETATVGQTRINITLIELQNEIRHLKQRVTHLEKHLFDTPGSRIHSIIPKEFADLPVVRTPAEFP